VRSFLSAFLGRVLVAAFVVLALPAQAERTLLVFGDSLSAAYGLSPQEGWVALLAQRIARRGLDWKVVNASVSGETTAGGLRRLPQDLQRHKPAAVLIELGANDALRGLPMGETRKNLEAMATLAQASGAKVLVAGMMVPPNFGRKYQAEFGQMYADVAAARHVALVPFLFAGVADRPDADTWFQADGIHPLAKAHPIILDNVWKPLLPLLKG